MDDNIVVIISLSLSASLSIYISNHYVVHLKPIQYYMSIKKRIQRCLKCPRVDKSAGCLPPSLSNEPLTFYSRSQWAPLSCLPDSEGLCWEVTGQGSGKAP